MKKCKKRKKEYKLWDYEKVFVTGNVVLASVALILSALNAFFKSMFIYGFVYGMLLVIWFILIITMHNVYVGGKILEEEWEKLKEEFEE